MGEKNCDEKIYYDERRERYGEIEEMNIMKRKKNVSKGGKILVDEMRINGEERVLWVKGERYIDEIEEFKDEREEIEMIVWRKEGGE